MSEVLIVDRIGFIGLGNMGGAIVERMLSLNVEVIGYDTNQAALDKFAVLGLSSANSVKEVADRASLVIVCVPTGGNPNIAREAVKGSAIEIFAELSTMKPEKMREIEDIISPHNIFLVDAPVSGGVSIAARGELSLMMAGPEAAMTRLAHSMSTVTAHAFQIGETPGQAQLCKLVNNAIGFTLFIASCEALVVGASAGIEPSVLLDAINAGSGRNSWTADKFGPHVLSRTFDAGGKLGGGPPALDLYLDEAVKVGMSPGMVSKARELWAKITELYDPLQDFTTMIQYFESFVGVELTSPANKQS